MKSGRIKITAVLVLVLMAAGLIAPAAFSQDVKIGYVDLRRAFYEYDKTKTLEEELEALTEDTQDKRTKMIEEITKMRDEAALMSDDAKKKKQRMIDAKLAELQEFDRDARANILNKKNDMFRVVIEDIQAVVEKMGKEGGYDYILDSRQLMYTNENFDLTDEVLKRLNK